MAVCCEPGIGGIAPPLLGQLRLFWGFALDFGPISGPDIEALKAHGVAEVFTPGSPLDTITGWLETALDQRASQPTP